MVTMKHRHYAWRKTITIYSNNMITWQHNSNVIRNPNDAISRRRSHLLALSERCHCIIDPVRFFTGGTPAERRGGIGAVPL